MTTRREITRAATYDEIKRTALGLMRAQGRTDISFSDIAREMRMTAPALYRYYAGRDDLLTDLITDGFRDLGDALGAARSAAGPGLRAQLGAVCSAYRRWAHAAPERFGLLFGVPVPGYAAPEGGPTVEAAQHAFDNLKAVIVEAATAGVLRPAPADTTLPKAIQASLRADHDFGDVPPALIATMLHTWCALHGFVTLETYGNLDWIGDEARDALFADLLDVVADRLGLPADS